MIYHTVKRYETTTIRKAWSGDGKVQLAIVGTVADLLRVGLLDYCEYDPALWCAIPTAGHGRVAMFGKTREEAVMAALEQGARWKE